MENNIKLSMPFRPDGYGPQRYLRAMTSIVGHARFLVLVAFEIYLLFYLLMRSGNFLLDLAK